MTDPTSIPIRPSPALGTVVVFAGGDPMTSVSGPLPTADFAIAADSGLDQAHRLGYRVDLVLGDFDSVSAEALSVAEIDGTELERYPAAKDATDLELALDAALALDPREIVVIGGHGGRVDHFLAGALALTRDATAAVDVRALMGPARVYVVRDLLTIGGDPTELLTLLAVRGPATGVTTDGLLYPLHDETLWPGSTRGVSNELLASTATVRVGTGVLLAVLPGELGSHQSSRCPGPSTGPSSVFVPDQE
jgi:thiamine pyrophosphokinase